MVPEKGANKWKYDKRKDPHDGRDKQRNQHDQRQTIQQDVIPEHIVNEDADADSDGDIAEINIDFDVAETCRRRESSLEKSTVRKKSVTDRVTDEVNDWLKKHENKGQFTAMPVEKCQ